MKDKIIFLDIDGVITSQDYYSSNYYRLKRREYIQVIKELPDAPISDGFEFDPNAVDLLNKLFEQTGAKVILSSTYRHGDWRKSLGECGLNLNFIVGTTPIYTIKDRISGSSMSCPRGWEIRNWLKENEGSYSDYLIIDDSSDMMYEQRDHFIHCNQKHGFTKEDFRRAWNFLTVGTFHGK